MEPQSDGFIPANLPGCQMMSNIQYVPASNPETGRWKYDFIPTAIGGIRSLASDDDSNYVPASIGTDAPLINSKVAKYDFVPGSGASGPGPFSNSGGNTRELSYIPCSSSTAPGPNGVVASTTHKLSWWESNSFFTYPCMLISAYYGIKWQDDFREHFNIPDNFIIIGDSGGFQNMTQNATLNPIDVLRWQEKHCQIGLTFDLPIFGNDDEEMKKKKQIETVKNAYIALNNRKNLDLKLYAVFQGHTLEEQQFILNEYKKQGDLEKFDGFAIGGLVPIAGNTELLTNVLLLFLESIKQYNKPVHFFGLSGRSIIPIILWMRKKYNIPITFDSSSYGGGAIRREYWIGNSKFKIAIPTTTLKKLPCLCPICSKCTIEDMKADGSVSGGLIALHNLYQTIEEINVLNSLIMDDSLFLDYVQKNNKKEVIDSIEKVNYMVENGVDKTLRRYNIKTTASAPEKTTNLFSFQ